MRQTLIRIILDEHFAIRQVEGVLGIGVGFLLVPWLLFGLWSVYRSRRNNAGRAELGSEWLLWGIGSAVIIAIPFVVNRAAIPSGVPVFGYGAMMFLGFLAAVFDATRRARRLGISSDLFWDLGMYVLGAGVIGSRLFYILQYPEKVFADARGFFGHLKAAVNLPQGGLVLYGGVIAAVAVFFLFCWRRRINPLFLVDVIAPSFFLGLAFGRIGCFLNGCCFGDRCEMPWAVQFPAESVPWSILVSRGIIPPDAPNTLPLHPTQLYSTIDALVLAFLTATYFKYRRRDGEVLALSLMTYPVTRFLIELLRGDEMGQFNTALTISQWVSICLFGIGVLFAAWLSTRPSLPAAPALG